MPGASQSIRSRFVISVVLLLSLFFLLALAVHFAQRQVQRLVTEATDQHTRLPHSCCGLHLPWR